MNNVIEIIVIFLSFTCAALFLREIIQKDRKSEK